MNAGMLLPDPRFRSPTALAGKSDLRDDHIYSAAVLQHGGQGSVSLFTVPKGQAIPKLHGSGVTESSQAHHNLYTLATTSMAKAGELGSGIGDIAIRSISLTFEQAAVTPATGAARAFGATQFEIADVQAKCWFDLKIANKSQIKGPTWNFGAAGGVAGSISTTGNAATASIAQNGVPGNVRRLKLPIPCARNDTLEGVLEVAGGASLAFSDTTGEGQPFLVWSNLFANVAGDVR